LSTGGTESAAGQSEKESDASVVAFLLRVAEQLNFDQDVVEVWVLVLVEAAFALFQ